MPKSGGFFVTGGISTNSEKEELLKTTEIFIKGKWSNGPELAIPVSHHCLVQLDYDRLVKGSSLNYFTQIGTISDPPPPSVTLK